MALNELRMKAFAIHCPSYESLLAVCGTISARGLHWMDGRVPAKTPLLPEWTVNQERTVVHLSETFHRYGNDVYKCVTILNTRERLPVPIHAFNQASMELLLEWTAWDREIADAAKAEANPKAIKEETLY